MKSLKNLPVAALAVLLGACLFAYVSTRDSGKPAAPGKNPGAAEQPLVDASMLPSALKLAPLAATAEEQEQAREAWRLADHDLDLTFAAALREAAADTETALPATGPLRQLRDRITALKTRVQADKKRVEDLGKDEGDALDHAQAQLDLDQDELDDIRADFAREGGDKRARLQRLLQEHEASEKIADQTIRFGAPHPTGTV